MGGVTMLQPINKKARAVMDKLTEGITQGGSKKIDNTGGAFMPVCVEKVGAIPWGPVFSVAHYYEQNGDLMADPDMTFVQSASGEYYPLTYQQDGLGLYQEVIVKTDENGKCLSYRPKLSKQLATFAGMWMSNIKQQQRIAL
jgi:hypothetical protein